MTGRKRTSPTWAVTMSAPTKFCRDCGFEALLPVLTWTERPACSVCGCKKFVDECDLPWELRVNNVEDQIFLKIQRIYDKQWPEFKKRISEE
jgi:hypothetical protein